MPINPFRPPACASIRRDAAKGAHHPVNSFDLGSILGRQSSAVHPSGVTYLKHPEPSLPETTVLHDLVLNAQFFGCCLDRRKGSGPPRRPKSHPHGLFGCGAPLNKLRPLERDTRSGVHSKLSHILLLWFPSLCLTCHDPLLGGGPWNANATRRWAWNF